MITIHPIAFSPAVRHPGTNRVAINAERFGKPVGQLWTFSGRGERHGWHAKVLNGEYRLFDSGNKKVDLVDAQIWIAAQ